MKTSGITLSIGVSLVIAVFVQTLGWGEDARANNLALAAIAKLSHRGKVDVINPKEGRLVVNRNVYRISSDTRTYGPTGEPVPTDTIRQGIFIALGVNANTNFVNEIWIIPVE